MGWRYTHKMFPKGGLRFIWGCFTWGQSSLLRLSVDRAWGAIIWGFTLVAHELIINFKLTLNRPRDTISATAWTWNNMDLACSEGRVTCHFYSIFVILLFLYYLYLLVPISMNIVIWKNFSHCAVCLHEYNITTYGQYANTYKGQKAKGNYAHYKKINR